MPAKEKTFEESLNALEEIVQRLEREIGRAHV